MFSQSQILQDLPKQFFVNLVAKVNAKQAEGYDVINLGQGNPDQPTYDFIVDALIASAKNPVSHKYSSFRGNAHFKEAVSQFYREHYQVDLNSEKEICVLGGAKIGLVEFLFLKENLKPVLMEFLLQEVKKFVLKVILILCS